MYIANSFINNYPHLRVKTARIRKKPRPPLPTSGFEANKSHLLLYVKNVDVQEWQNVGVLENAAQPALAEAMGNCIGADWGNHPDFPSGLSVPADAVPILGNLEASHFLAEFDETIDYQRETTELLRDRFLSQLGPETVNDRSVDALLDMCLYWAKKYLMVRNRTLNTAIRNDGSLAWREPFVQGVYGRRSEVNTLIHSPRLEDEILWCEVGSLAPGWPDNTEAEEYVQNTFRMTIDEAKHILNLAFERDDDLPDQDKRTIRAKYICWVISMINQYVDWRTHAQQEIYRLLKHCHGRLWQAEVWNRDRCGDDAERTYSVFVHNALRICSLEPSSPHNSATSRYYTTLAADANRLKHLVKTNILETQQEIRATSISGWLKGYREEAFSRVVDDPADCPPLTSIPQSWLTQPLRQLERQRFFTPNHVYLRPYTPLGS